MCAKKWTTGWTWLFGALLLFAVPVAAEVKITAADRSADDEFGKAVSIFGDHAVVGTYLDNDRGKGSGSAYVFRRNGTDWSQQAKLTASDGLAYNYFGCSVALSQTFAAVGAFGKDFGTGAAYVFQNNGSGWAQQAILHADDGSMNDNFGYSVSVSGHGVGACVLVGAYRDDDRGRESGAAYVFRYDGTSWAQQAKLLPDEGETGDNFGRSLAISGADTSNPVAIVGAMHDSEMGAGAGSAYVFAYDGSEWVQQARLFPDDGEGEDFFGVSVAISGDHAIVGAYADDDQGHNTGAAYVFTRQGTDWIQQAKLTPADGAAEDNFGRSVGISGGQGKEIRAIVGADANDALGEDAGAAYLFQSDDGLTWIQQAKLTPKSGDPGDSFGWAVSISDENVISGAYGDDDNGSASGSAYIYDFETIAEAITPNIHVNPTSLTFNKNRSVTSLREGAIRSPFTDAESHCQRTPADTATEYATGLVIPEHVQSYWKNFVRPPRKPGTQSLPELMDWSIYDSPVKSQGGCGSCWVFAGVALVENLGNQAGLQVEQDLSEQAILSCAVGDGCWGGWYWDALNYIRKSGIPPETCYPYLISNGSCDDHCESPDFMEKITDFTPSPGMWGEDHSVDDLKEALQNGPLCVAMRIPDDGTFRGNGYRGGVYDYDGDTISWSANGHSVLLVGYDDQQQCFKVKNSWGASWGENGYFRISYDDVSDDVRFGSYACSASGIYLDGNRAEFTISNLGDGDLVISEISADKSWLALSLPDIPITVPGDGTQGVTVSVSDWQAVGQPEDSGNITIRSNDPDTPVAVVSVKTFANTTSTGQPVLMVSPPFEELSDTDGTLHIYISNGGGGSMNWSAQADVSWLTFASENSGTDTGMITVQYEANAGETRIGKITISATGAGADNSPQSVEIRQAGFRPGGDVDGKNGVSLTDAIISLKVAAGMQDISESIRSDYAASDADVNGDARIGLAEAVFILARISE